MGTLLAVNPVVVFCREISRGARGGGDVSGGGNAPPPVLCFDRKAGSGANQPQVFQLQDNLMCTVIDTDIFGVQPQFGVLGHFIGV